LPPEVSPEGGAIPAHAAKKTIRASDAALKISLLKLKTPIFLAGWVAAVASRLNQKR
jgi:hypothetical protein